MQERIDEILALMQNPARGDGSDNVYCFFSEVRKDAGEN
nr:MAG TPA: hypothetical protein [Caudoviricetes sp.]